MLRRLGKAYLKAWIALAIAAIFFSCIGMVVEGYSLADVFGVFQLILTTPIFLGMVIFVSVLLGLTFLFDHRGSGDDSGFGGPGGLI